MNIYQKLLNIQNNLKAPKNQFNKFGNYKYRSLEDIQKALKPLLHANEAALILKDTIKEIGGRIYVEATATLFDVKAPELNISAIAFAREAESKKGMSEDQITGAASSYARKYCLNGLFCIDDTKDFDFRNNDIKQPQREGIGTDNIKWLTKFCIKHDIKTEKEKADMMKHYGFSVNKTTQEQFLLIKAKMIKEHEGDKNESI